MNDDIVARLRDVKFRLSFLPKGNKLVMSPQNVLNLYWLLGEAADEIERLGKRIAELEAERVS